MLDRQRLKLAFELLGQDLARRKVFVEIAVYGASSLILQFESRRTTEDVDAVVRQGYDEALLAPSVADVADRMDLAPDWLNNAVGMFTPLVEDDALFTLSGTYPSGDRPGLRVLLAKPHYLLAMKLLALASLDRGDKDLLDARALATALGVADVVELQRLYVSIHGDQPSEDVKRQLASVLNAS